MRTYKYSIIALLCLGILASIIEPSFLTAQNFLNIIRQASVLLLLSIGLTGVVLTGNIDLSIGAIAALSGCTCAKMMVGGNTIFLSVLCGLLIGIIIGIVNGLLIAYLNLPSFIASYGVQMLVSGLALILMNGGIIYDLPSNFTFLGIGHLGKVPVPIVICLVLVLFFHLLWNNTTFGRNVYLIGSNKSASSYSGIKTRVIIMISFLISGLGASLAGIIITARLNAADAGMCDAYGLQIVAAVVLGGTSLMGGEGGAFGTVLGAGILTIIVNIMNIMGVGSAWQNLFMGLVMIMIVFLQYWLGKRCQTPHGV